MHSKEIDLNEAREYILGISLEAGNILEDRFKEIDDQMKRKGAIAQTSEVDEAVDRFITAEIKEKYPQSQFLTEKTTPQNYSKVQDGDCLWVVDSLDGRINFSRGHQNFATSIALVQNSVTRLGIIYMPMADETYWAQENIEGAFLNQEPIRVSEIRQFRDVLVALDWPYNHRQRETVLRWATCLAPHIRQIKSTGSAVSDLALVAAGKIDAYVQLGTKPWDTAAGSLLVQKAGGRVTTPEGGNWNPFNHLILASNGIVHDPIIDLIKE